MLLSFTRACRDAVAFSASLSVPFANPVRNLFMKFFKRKFSCGERILPAYEARRQIDVFYIGKMDALMARLFRLLQVPAEPLRLIKEIARVSNEEAERIASMFLRMTEGLISFDGKLATTIMSSHLLEGSHEDWSEHRALYDLILHMPPGVNVNLILNIASKMLPKPKKVLKDLYDKGIIYLQGVEKETFVWVAHPPPKSCSLALQELRKRSLQDAALYLLRNPLRIYSNGTSDFKLKEALKVLVLSGVVSPSLKMPPLNSLSLEAALSEVYPLISLVYDERGGRSPTSDEN